MQEESSSRKVHFPGLDWEAEEAKSKQGTQSRKARRARRREQKQHTDRMKEIEGAKRQLVSFLDSAQNSEEICQLPQLDCLAHLVNQFDLLMQLVNQEGLTPREALRLLLDSVDVWYPNEAMRLLVASWRAEAISKGLYNATESFSMLASFWPRHSKDAAGLNLFLSFILRKLEAGKLKDVELCELLIGVLLDMIADLNPQLLSSRREEWDRAREEFEAIPDRGSAILKLYRSFRDQANPMATEDGLLDGSWVPDPRGAQSTEASSAGEYSYTQGSGEVKR